MALRKVWCDGDVTDAAVARLDAACGQPLKRYPPPLREDLIALRRTIPIAGSGSVRRGCRGSVVAVGFVFGLSTEETVDVLVSLKPAVAHQREDLGAVAY